MLTVQYDIKKKERDISAVRKIMPLNAINNKDNTITPNANETAVIFFSVTFLAANRLKANNAVNSIFLKNIRDNGT